MSCHVKIATKVTKKATPSLIHLFPYALKDLTFDKKDL